MTDHTQAELEWRDGQPVSCHYGDVYFSRESGIAETRYVFLQQNRLRERWQSFSSHVFTIAETGFGTGLNFLCAWQLWRETAPADARLHFVSTEKYPLSQADLSRALALWPELAELGAALLGQYRRIMPGWQCLDFDDGRVTLTLLVGDARETLPQLHASVDAWFLDGFAPAKNPDMWQPELLAELARLAAPGCTLATFTSVGAVRRGLEAAGFKMEKIAGFGSKRDMLRGEYPSATVPQAQQQERRAIVIGGGIAGTSSAYALARRGWRVTLIERHSEVAQEASGNPQGVLYPRLSGHDIPLSRVALSGFLHTLRLAERLLEKGRDWDNCGLLQQAFNAREAKRCEEVLARSLPPELVHAVDAAEAGRLTGALMLHGGLWFADGGWVYPPALCRALAETGIERRFSSEALQLQKSGEFWQVLQGGAMLAEAPVVVVCTANDTARFTQLAHLPLEPVRGQITQIPATAESTRLRAVVCTEGYIGPARDGLHCVGATFHPDDAGLDMRAADHAENLAMLGELSPALFDSLGGTALEPQQLQGRVALRCVAPDYLPMAGWLLDPALLLERYEIGSRKSAEHLPWLDGLFVNTAHGSKGLLTAPLCAELIASLIENEPLPVDAALARALDPNRFLLRERGLKRLVGAALMKNH